ncbi:hypothetical protein [Actinomadura welshii]|uniref:hypothetical protein n=1 Tax=Actinomadura welshii TaxID=3103817 RepID=UPI003B8A85E2
MFSIPMRTRSRGVTQREGVLIQGPAGWAPSCHPSAGAPLTRSSDSGTEWFTGTSVPSAPAQATRSAPRQR